MYCENIKLTFFFWWRLRPLRGGGGELTSMTSSGAGISIWLCFKCEKPTTYPGVRDLELSEDVLGHVVLCHGIHHKVLVPGGALCWPVLVALFL